MGRAVQIAWKKKGGILDIKREGEGKKKSLVETSKEESKGKRADQQGGEGRRKECLPACQTMLPLLSCSQLFVLEGVRFAAM